MAQTKEQFFKEMNKMLSRERETKERGHDPSSFLVYWPLIKVLNIPQPKTMIVLIESKEMERLYEGELIWSLRDKVQSVIDIHFTLPVFIRTDLSSGKHSWKDTCFFDGSKKLSHHLMGIAEFNFMADMMGLDFKAFVIREYIPMASRFTAFRGDMPVNPERRYFAEGGNVLCHHPYWIPGAIEACSQKASKRNWRALIKKMNHESAEEIGRLSTYAIQVSRVCPGFWSVDFCQAKDGRWILIDMALAQASWHPEDCPAGWPK